MPTGSTSTSGSTTRSKAGFVSLVRAVRAALDATRPGLVLTFDATSYRDGYRLADALAPSGADAVLLMGYDFRTVGATTWLDLAHRRPALRRRRCDRLLPRCRWRRRG